MDVHQVVRSLDGEVLADRRVVHVYALRDGLVERMDVEEAEALLHTTAAQLASDEVTALVDRTEGWPAGLYLAALSAATTNADASPHTTLTGNDPFVYDFLRSELIASLPADELMGQRGLYFYLSSQQLGI